jgi:hypothetical protein
MEEKIRNKISENVIKWEINWLLGEWLKECSLIYNYYKLKV